MQDIDDPETGAAEVVGFLGLALAVLGISDVPTPIRFSCLLGASLCLPISFHRQAEWPQSARWMLSLLTNSFLAYVAWASVYRR